MKPRAKSFRTTPKQPHSITVKQLNGAYRVQCSCGETIGGMHSGREMGRRAGREHLRQVAPHLCGPRTEKKAGV